MIWAGSGVCVAVMVTMCLAGLQLAAAHTPVRIQSVTGRYRSLQLAAARQTGQDTEAMHFLQQFAAEGLRHRRRRRLQQVATPLRIRLGLR